MKNIFSNSITVICWLISTMCMALGSIALVEIMLGNQIMYLTPTAQTTMTIYLIKIFTGILFIYANIYYHAKLMTWKR